jgi:hypothetical protein
MCCSKYFPSYNPPVAHLSVISIDFSLAIRSQLLMERKQITLADGRYLIFYSFDDETRRQASPPSGEENVEQEETHAQHEAEDGQRV